jgi:hypothetical protein
MIRRAHVPDLLDKRTQLDLKALEHLGLEKGEQLF